MNIKLKKFVAYTLLSAGISGCAGEIHRTSRLGDIDILSVDARQRLVLRGTDEHGNSITCAEPSPDAIVASAAALAAQANVTSGNNSGGGGFAASFNEAAASIGLRTQTIQLMRDGYYRLCEALLNRQIDNKAYDKVVNNIDQFMIAMLAIDSLGGTARAPAVAIGTNGKATVAKEGTTVDATTGIEKAMIEEIKVASQAMTPDQAKAINELATNYLLMQDNYRRDLRTGKLPNG